MSESLAKDVMPVSLEEEMKRSYLDYAMSVIVSRALPDVRDGLKPVHRRILYAMKEAGNDYNRPYRKSARVVGDVMGKYHPHGNMPIYDAMVRLTQDFSLRFPLIDGQGNFGSMDGDPPAAERYTEARLSRGAHDLLEDIDKDTVDWQPNYDNTLQEPRVLPSRFPNLLVNGANGIAVGMATSIPTHNLGEVLDACCAIIDNPDIDLSELMTYIPGPDFPTGGSIMGRHGILEGFRTGRGSMVVRGKTTVEPIANNREAIIVNELPFQVNKAKFVEKIAHLVRDKVIEGISDLRDESDREGMRVVIELKRDAVTDVVLNQLYRHTQLQTGQSFNMLAIVHGRPQQLSLIDILKHFIDFREEIVVRRTRFDLAKARAKAHALLGFAIAVANIDPVIDMIRSAPDRHIAKERLMEKAWPLHNIGPMVALVEEDFDESQESYHLSDVQAQAILDLRLHRLTGMERDKIRNDLDETIKAIQEYLRILASRAAVLEIVRDELVEIKERFPSPRRTTIEEGELNVDMEDLIQREDMVVTVSMEGYIKRVPLCTYRAQKRGGKGRSGMNTKEEDVVSDVFVANTHSNVLFFSTHGKVYRLKVYKLPLGSPQSKGRAMVNLLPLAAGETISTVLVLKDEKDREPTEKEQFLMFATSTGNVRRNRLSDFERIQSNGKIAMKLDEGESLIDVRLCEETDQILLATKDGLCNRFTVDNIRIFAGRNSNGVRGLKLKAGDEIIGMSVLHSPSLDTDEREAYLKMSRQDGQEGEDNTETSSENAVTLSEERFKELSEKEEFILTVTENGYGKRSSAYHYRTTNRGSQGFANIVVNERNGGVVSSVPIEETDQIMLVTDQGKLIRCPIHDVRIAGRRTQGVIIFRVDDNEKVVAVSRIKIEDEEDTSDEISQEETPSETETPQE